MRSGVRVDLDGPPLNRSVHEMFDRAASRYADCARHEHWRSTTGAVVCGVCHPPGHPSLVAEWIEAEAKEGL